SDTHWNRFGASFGYRALADRIAAEGFPIRPIEIDRSKREPWSRVGDLALLLGVGKRRVDPSWRVPTPRGVRALVVSPRSGDPRLAEWKIAPHLVTENPAGELGRAVVFRDSCATELLHWLPIHFRHARFSWLDPQSAAFAWSIVRDERPEIVIDQFVERKLSLMPEPWPDDPASPRFDPAWVPPVPLDGAP
ncbi:MAG: hypothetical protein ACREQJ_02305, partial [Candidatus Binatia bacterium]